MKTSDRVIVTVVETAKSELAVIVTVDLGEVIVVTVVVARAVFSVYDVTVSSAGMIVVQVAFNEVVLVTVLPATVVV